MPGSVIQGKAEIKKWIEDHPDIKTIVDVGAGSATYPKYVDGTYPFNLPLQFEGKHRWIAIEVWEPYVEQWELHKYYDQIIIADARQVDWPEADCVIFGDVLEHIDKESALQIIRKTDKKYKHAIISIPISEHEGEVRPAMVHYGNEHEAHVSAWTFRELEELLAHWPFHLFAHKNQVGVFAK